MGRNHVPALRLGPEVERLETREPIGDPSESRTDQHRIVGLALPRISIGPEPTVRGTLTPEQIREMGVRGQEKAKEREKKLRDQARELKKQSLLSDKQLVLWIDAVRGAPNEIVRSALFTAKNRKQPRENLKQAVVAVIGEGQITYTGEELRQDDETVWLQLIHLARENGLSTAFQFTPYSFCQAINWPINGYSFDRLNKCMTRLQATSLKITSKRLGDEVSLAMLPGYKAKRRKDVDGSGGFWTVRMHDELVFLFSEAQYTRLEWQQRLALPEGLATWLHAYYASHREPFPVKVETIAMGAGLLKDASDDDQLEAEVHEAKRKFRLREVKKLIKNSLGALKEVGFLADFEVTRGGLVTVRRTAGAANLLIIDPRSSSDAGKARISLRGQKTA